jgi:hypothetical protein
MTDMVGVTGQPKTLSRAALDAVRGMRVHQWLKNILGLHAPGSTLPVLIADGQVFLAVDYYGSDALRACTYYLMDLEAATRRTGSAWFDTTYPTAKRMLQIRSNIELADQFLARRQNFLMYSTGYVVEWLVPELLARGWHLRLLGKNAAVVMLEATPAVGESAGVP